MVNYKQIQSIDLFIVLIVDVAHIFILCNLCNQESKWKTQFIVLIVDVAHIFILCNLCNQESKWKTQYRRKALEQYKKNYSKNFIY